MYSSSNSILSHLNQYMTVFIGDCVLVPRWYQEIFQGLTYQMCPFVSQVALCCGWNGPLCMKTSGMHSLQYHIANILCIHTIFLWLYLHFNQLAWFQWVKVTMTLPNYQVLSIFLLLYIEKNFTFPSLPVGDVQLWVPCILELTAFTLASFPFYFAHKYVIYTIIKLWWM